MHERIDVIFGKLINGTFSVEFVRWHLDAIDRARVRDHFREWLKNPDIAADGMHEIEGRAIAATGQPHNRLGGLGYEIPDRGPLLRVQLRYLAGVVACPKNFAKSPAITRASPRLQGVFPLRFEVAPRPYK